MSLSSGKVGTTLVVSAQGQINSANAGAIETTLLDWVEQGERQYILDLKALDYISGDNIRTTVGAHLCANRPSKQMGGSPGNAFGTDSPDESGSHKHDLVPCHGHSGVFLPI